jgi:hypothetical protein
VTGIAVSIAANIAHSFVPPGADELARLGVTAAEYRPHGGAVALAVFWPVALLIGIEVVARTPWRQRLGWNWETVARLGLVPVAAVAAMVSYLHLSGLLLFYGEGDATSYVGPAAIDGLMILCSGALIATAGRRREPQSEAEEHYADGFAYGFADGYDTGRRDSEAAGVASSDPWPDWSLPAVSPVASEPMSPPAVSPVASIDGELVAHLDGRVERVASGSVASRVSPPPGVAVKLPAEDVPLPFEPDHFETDPAVLAVERRLDEEAGDTGVRVGDSRPEVAATERPAVPDVDPADWIMGERGAGRAPSGADVARAYGKADPEGRVSKSDARWGQRQVKRADLREREQGRTLRAVN